MGRTRDYLALDLGATSGRAVLGAINDRMVRLREVRRFPNGPIPHRGHLHWNWLALREEIETCMVAAASESNAIESVGCDAWGLDHGFFDAKGHLIELPFCYQDSRTDGALEDISRTMTPEAVFARTAAPVAPISTLGQLLVTRRMRPDILERAESFAFMPGLVHRHLTGTLATEYCGACSSSLCSWKTQAWDAGLIEAFGLPAHIFPPMAHVGGAIGAVQPKQARRLGIPAWEVRQPSGHDTALAVAAAPMEPGDMVISSGTWAMLGLAVASPPVDRPAFESGGGTYAVPGDEWVFMRGIMGLWLLERFRKEEGLPDVATLEEVARREQAPACIFPPDDPRLLRGVSFRQALGEVLSEKGLTPPQHASAVVRSILESLAFFVARTLRSMERVTGVEVRRIVVVGGGSLNHLLNQLTADATGLPVVTGSSEATAMGNVLVQAKGRGDLADWRQVREMAAQSSPRRLFEPHDSLEWKERRDRLVEDLEKGV